MQAMRPFPNSLCEYFQKSKPLAVMVDYLKWLRPDKTIKYYSHQDFSELLRAKSLGGLLTSMITVNYEDRLSEFHYPFYSLEGQSPQNNGLRQFVLSQSMELDGFNIQTNTFCIPTEFTSDSVENFEVGLWFNVITPPNENERFVEEIMLHLKKLESNF